MRKCNLKKRIWIVTVAMLLAAVFLSGCAKSNETVRNEGSTRVESLSVKLLDGRTKEHRYCYENEKNRLDIELGSAVGTDYQEKNGWQNWTKISMTGIETEMLRVKNI